ncbi:VOC family protein [Achromobacter ruhlandii]|uniref:VOC family protein n=1 Tax=Achromobacter ruhlandii TaxID=72557 RepID=UPI000C25AB89|nr:VOC family protein [Achromobacter ruhlandii]PJM87324.1 glyoxalase [Achromobacter ruhlandii]
MFSHVCLGVGDFDRAYAFYSVLADALGLEPRFFERERPWAGWQPAGGGRPLLVIGAPLDGAPATSGNGQMTAFLAADRATVDRCHALALAHGGRCEGPPGLRPHYHADYYGAYFRDPDGNKLCVVCHTPPERAGHAAIGS